jgi:heavy metal translocating P-type ATPase
MHTSDQTIQTMIAGRPGAIRTTVMRALPRLAPAVTPGFGRAAGIPIATVLMMLMGIAFSFSPFTAKLATPTWTVGLVVIGGRVVWRTVAHALAGHFATDLVASMAIITAVAVGQPLPGLIVVLMQTGGEALEAYARGRASEAVRALEEAAPRLAHRIVGDEVFDVGVDQIAVDDLLLIRPGELIPCDAVVVAGDSHVDASQLTGEPVPVRARAGVALMSGSLNGDRSFTARATAPASESQYARIVELVRNAQASKAPLQRLADRYAVWFTPITLAACAATYLATGDASRILAILVVATPCPLILAAPVAIIGGINRAARRQVIFRHGGALEQLGHIDVAVFDKTGTLTIGLPQVSRVISGGSIGESELLRLAAGVEQASSHLLARTIVHAAAEAEVLLPPPSHVTEAPGRGVVGEVAGHEVAVGARSFILERYPAAAESITSLAQRSSGLRAFIAVDGAAGGVIEFADRLRQGVKPFFDELQTLGIPRTILLSGDDAGTTAAAATAVGIREARGDLLPSQKAEIVEQLVDAGEHVLMVGDGTNDAPALGTATVGIALAGHGGGITAEAADVVVLVDDLSRIGTAIRIGRRTLKIARQSIWAGLGLSGAAMVFAALGMIPPITGALLQEAIDVAVILNALRASR